MPGKDHHHMPEGMAPLQERIHRERQAPQPQERTLPELRIIVGRDLDSSGLTISILEETGGRWPHYETLYAARWAAPVLTRQGALEMAAKGAAAALAELFPPDTEQ